MLIVYIRGEGAVARGRRCWDNIEWPPNLPICEDWWGSHPPLTGLGVCNVKADGVLGYLSWDHIFLPVLILSFSSHLSLKSRLHSSTWPYVFSRFRGVCEGLEHRIPKEFHPWPKSHYSATPEIRKEGLECVPPKGGTLFCFVSRLSVWTTRGVVDWVAFWFISLFLVCLHCVHCLSPPPSHILVAFPNFLEEIGIAYRIEVWKYSSAINL